MKNDDNDSHNSNNDDQNNSDANMQLYKAAQAMLTIWLTASAASMLALRSNSSFTTSTWPIVAAEWRDEYPPL